MIETAKASRDGWIDYQGMDPESKKLRTRGIYFQKIEGQDAVVGCTFLKRPTLPVLKERPQLASTAQKQDDAGKSRVFVPDVGLVMRWCPPGSFTMGSNNPSHTYHDSPPHQVTLTRGFWIGETEVTQAQWEAVMGSNPASEHSMRGDRVKIPEVSFKGPDMPIISVSQEEIMDFCKKLTDHEHEAGRLPADAVYALPTEAQWVYAAGAGGNLTFADDLDTIAWFQTNGDSMLHPVAQKLPNAWGLYDTRGNAWEFCSDWFGDYSAGAVTDPAGPTSGEGHVIRGGGWDAPYNDCLTARRKFWPASSGRYYVGFRLVCTAGLE
jgi:formylglycine-generating enzyme required for sulfatase activity